MGLRDLVKWNRPESSAERHEHAWTALQRDMNSLISDFSRSWMSGWADSGLGSWSSFTPRVELRETDKTVEVTAELPGLDEKDVTLTLSADGQVLHLAGEKKSEKHDERGGVTHTERYYGRFSRDIALPAEVHTDTKGTEATFKNGVLRVHLAKRHDGAHASRRIKISVQ